MSVIINDFEVVIEEAEESGKTAPTTVGAPPPPVLTPLDIRDILRRQEQRRQRVEAY